MQQNLNQGKPGQKCTKCGRGQPEVWFYSRPNKYGKYFTRELCNECYSAQKRSQNAAVRKMFGPGATHKVIAENRPPEGTPCQCCGKPMVHGPGSDKCCFDHDPITDEFRGWICMKCNTGLGNLGDTLQSALNAVRYLTPPNEIIN